MFFVGVNGVANYDIGKLKVSNGGRTERHVGCWGYVSVAAVEQLQAQQRNNVPVIAQSQGSDAASVVFDAVQAAKARDVDILLVDTAGRLQAKTQLMDELAKVRRVVQRLDPDAP